MADTPEGYGVGNLELRLEFAENLLKEGGITPQMLSFYEALHRVNDPRPDIYEVGFPILEDTCVGTFVFDRPFRSLKDAERWLVRSGLSYELVERENRYQIREGLFHADLFGCAGIAALPEEDLPEPDDDIPF